MHKYKEEYTREIKRESITYLNHLRFHYFDFCNFMKRRKNEKDPNNNEEYFCDILKYYKKELGLVNTEEYDSTRSTEFLYEWYGESL